MGFRRPTTLQSAGLLLMLCSTGSAQFVITEYSNGLTGSFLTGIATGSDGALWFTEFNAAPFIVGSRIGRITSAVITEFSAGLSAGSAPDAIVAGLDGALWFRKASSDGIGRITTTGVITEFSIVPTLGGYWAESQRDRTVPCGSLNLALSGVSLRPGSPPSSPPA